MEAPSGFGVRAHIFLDLSVHRRVMWSALFLAAYPSSASRRKLGVGGIVCLHLQLDLNHERPVRQPAWHLDAQ